MAGGVDQELKRAFAELQSKLVDTRQRVKMADAQIDALKRSTTREGLTWREVSALPAETRVFESVGRMFVLSDVASVQSASEGRQKRNQERIEAIENNKAYLERSLKESENSLRELVQHKKNALNN